MKIIFSLLVMLGFLSPAVAVDTKDWTVLVFMNGHDSLLSPYTTKNLDWMMQVGSTEHVNIVVQKGTIASPGAERLLVNKGSTQSLQKLNQVDMGDYKELQNFIKFAVDNFPAKHYVIDVWDHGTGWNIQTIGGGQFRPQDISYDSFSNNHITTEQLGLAMKYFSELIGHKVDVYGSDACLMAMAEVAGEMSDYVENFVGSQESEPLDGWPYGAWLARWANKDEATAKDVTTALVEEYITYYKAHPSRLGATFAAWDLNFYPQFVKSVGQMAAALENLNSTDMKMASDAVSASDTYDVQEFRDLMGFADQVQKSHLNVDNKVFAEFKTQFKNMVYANDGAGKHLGQSNGVSVWIPQYSGTYNLDANRYKNLKFDQQTQWSKFIEAVISAY